MCDCSSYLCSSDLSGVNSSCELDLFGLFRRGVESTRACTAARAADLDSAQLAIVGEVARTYFDLRGLQERLRVARENADNQRETLRLVDARLDARRANGRAACRGSVCQYV